MIIKILQWNILRKEDPDNVSGFIKKIGPDIVCLQEIIQNDEKNVDTGLYIANELGYNFFYKAGDTWQPAKNGKTSQGNAVFSKFTFTKTSFVYLTPPHHNPPDANFEGRIYVEAVFDVGNALLAVGTTHLAFSPRFTINEKRKKEVDNLTAIFESKKTNYVFTGDLNSPPNSYTIEQINKYLIHAGPDFRQPTWTTKPFDYHGQFKENKLRWRLDYVFTSQDVKIVDSRILKTIYSDHLPILLTIEI